MLSPLNINSNRPKIYFLLSSKHTSDGNTINISATLNTIFPLLCHRSRETCLDLNAASVLQERLELAVNLSFMSGVNR